MLVPKRDLKYAFDAAREEHQRNVPSGDPHERLVQGEKEEKNDDGTARIEKRACPRYALANRAGSSVWTGGVQRSGSEDTSQCKNIVTLLVLTDNTYYVNYFASKAFVCQY